MYLISPSVPVALAEAGAVFKAAISYWTAQRDEAVATLELYFQKSVGIGEHSKILQEINDWTAKLSEANENLESLKTYFDDYGDVKDDNKTKKLLND